MTLDEAIELVRPAVPTRDGGTWADLGAGTGLFTRALAAILEPTAKIVAVDRDARALRTLRESIRREPASGVEVVTAEGDLRSLESIPALASIELDGALFANSLHFVPDAERVLVQTVQRLRERGRIVVVEYDGRPANPWVPYPVSLDRLAQLSAQASLSPPRVVSERSSAYGGTLYCAMLVRAQA